MTPRQRFVEAMRHAIDIIRWRDNLLQRRDSVDFRSRVERAAEAFADAECADKYEWIGDYPTRQIRHTEQSDHAACHASILKEIFGE